MREYLLPWPLLSNADFAQECIRIRQKTFRIALPSPPVARRGAAGGDFPGNRRESPHDERQLVLISTVPDLPGDALIELDLR